MVDAFVRIQGAGPVGIMLALFLVKSGWPKEKIELIDPAIHDPLPAHQEDPRVLAISHGTLLRLKQLGIDHNATRIKRIHVSSQGHFGMMEINTDRVGVNDLGALIGYANLLTRLRAKAHEAGLTMLAAANASSPDVLVVAEGGIYRGNESAAGDASAGAAAIASSGTSSGTSSSAAVSPTEMVLVRDYHQQAVIGWVHTTPAPGDTAFERFTQDGVLALLPVQDRFALIWCCAPHRATVFADAEPAAQAAMLRDIIGDRIGAIDQVQITGSYPLGLKWREQVADGHTVWIGNSAQMLHPIAGQGMNLGFRDAEALATCLLQRGQPVPDRLNDYARRRGADRWAVRTATDTLARQAWVRRAIGGVALIPGAKKLLGQVLMYGG
jgi:2-octaprenyl-6-methoxyphenol hydroxylase